MKFLFSASILAGALLLNACGDGRSDAAKKIAAVADSIKAARTIDLSEYHLPLQLVMPAGSPAPQVNWKEETGTLEVHAGPHFGLTIVEAPGDTLADSTGIAQEVVPGGMDRLKADLDRDLLRKNTILKDSPDQLMYQSQFPDDTTLVFFHYRQLVHAGRRTFIVEDLRMGSPYTQQDIDRMRKAVRPQVPA